MAFLKDKLLIIIFSFVAIASVADIFTDVAGGASMQHILKELVIVTISLITIIWILISFRQKAAEIEQLKNELDGHLNQPKPHPSDYIISARKQLSHVISQQFNDWGLSSSECEVGLLLLKGLSLKEIAAIRNTLEKTVRQQASAIYKKAQLSGRHEFSAWFMEDLL
jgi:DNA-binding CsgD family transcriptional regulator